MTAWWPRTTWRVVLAVWVLCAGAVSASGQVAAGGGVVGGDDTPSMLHVEGDAEQLYVVVTQVLPQQGGGGSARGTAGGGGGESAVVYRRQAGSATWQLLGVLAGRPRDVAIWRGQLAVLMTDGTWRTVYEGGSSAGVRPREGQLLRLSGDGLTLAGLLRVGEGLRVARLTSGQWETLTEAPAGAATAGPLAVDLLAQDGALYLAWRDGEGPAVRVAVGVSSSAGAGDGATGGAGGGEGGRAGWAWAELASLTPAEPVFALRWLRLGDQRWLWCDPGTTSGGEVFTLDGSVWRGFALGPDAGEAAAFAGRLRLFFQDTAAATRPSLWSPLAVPALMERVFTPEGEELGPPQRVELVSRPGQPEMLKLLAVGLAMGGLMSALLMSWRRRAELSPDVIMGAFRLPLASRMKRLAAGLVDAAPFLAVSGYVVATEGITWSEYVLTPRVMFYELVGIAFVVTHVALGEVVAGRSLGKALFGLRVTDLQGKRPPPGRVVLRSLFRAVDLMLVVPLLTVLISPLRQSIGDGAAGTVVVDDTQGDAGRPRAPQDGE